MVSITEKDEEVSPSDLEGQEPVDVPQEADGRADQNRQVSPVPESAPVAEVMQARCSSSPGGQEEFPMPVTANADVPDPTDRTSTARRQPNFVISLPGTPKFVLSPVNTPRPAGEAVPVSVTVPPSILRALRQQSQQPASPGPSHLLPQASVPADGLFTPSEPSATITPAEPPTEHPAQSSAQNLDDPHRQALDKLAEVLFGHIPLQERFGFDQEFGSSIPQVSAEQSLPEVPHQLRSGPFSSEARGSDDILEDIPGFDALESMHSASSLPSTISQRTPPIFMGVTLTRRGTDPVLMADPYPYSLSTPGPISYPIHYDMSEDETGLDISMSSNSTMEKELDEKDIFSLPDDGEGSEQYPSAPVQPTTNAGQDEKEALSVDASEDSATNTGVVASPPQFEEILKAEDPFKLMGTDSTVAPGPVKDDGESSSGEHSSETNTPDVSVFCYVQIPTIC